MRPQEDAPVTLPSYAGHVLATSTWLPDVARRMARGDTWVRAHPFSVDLAVAAVFAAASASVWLLFVRDTELRQFAPVAASSPGRELVIGCAVLAHLAIAFRRVRPLASFALVTTAAGIQLLASVYVVLPSMLLFLVALYSYCAYGPHGAPVVGFLTGTAGVAAVSTAGFALLGPIVTDPWFHVVVRLLPFLLCAWSLGMFRRVRLAYVNALRQRAERAEAEREQRARRAVADERARIAREMHDVVAHALSVVISQANGGRYLAQADPRRAMSVLETISEAGSQALSDTRGILRVLRDDDESDGRAPQPGLDDVPVLVRRVRQAGLTVDVAEHGERRHLAPSAELAAYRLVQEALTNTMKHAGDGARIWIDAEWAETSVVIRIRDNGQGSRDRGRGHGLLGMRERLSIVGGSLSAGDDPDGGWLTEASIPYEVQE